MNVNWQNSQQFNDTNQYNSYYNGVKFVTSLDEALMRANVRGSDDVYFHQDRPVFYRIKVDYDGRKTWCEFEYKTPNVSAPVQQTAMEDFSSIINRLEKLEKSVSNLMKVGNGNEESS